MLPIRVYVKYPGIILSAVLRKYGFWIPDKLYLQLLYTMETGKRLNLNNPKLFSEKIQWLKLYCRKPEYSVMVDKYAVKSYVSNIIGKDYVLPTLGVWDRPEDINFDELPQQFVLKTTNGGGNEGVVICRDKDHLDKETIVKRLGKDSKGDLYRVYREWPYKNVPRRIIAEPLIENMEDSNQDIVDYKFYCFNGIPKYCQVIKDRNTKETIDFFDMDWGHQVFYGLNPVYGPMIVPATIRPIKPMHFNEMVTIARKLSEGTAFSRIDLYDTFNGPLFGEITFYPASGIGTFIPCEYNMILGEMIKLPL